MINTVASLIAMGGTTSAASSMATDGDLKSMPPDVLSDLHHKYRIEKLIGWGATGEVYKVKNLVLDRFEAVKVISNQVTEESLMRMQEEARALSKAVHPGIVTIYDVAVTADGNPYILMEYVPGVPLSRIIERQSPLNPDWAIFIFAQMCFALDKAHQAGIVHRDLKPDNVIVARGTDGFDAVKIIDFGIARDSCQQGRRKQTGVWQGTPLYMSPEDFLGAEVSNRSDIYSLGCALFEMLSGHPPFAGATAFAIAYKHAFEDPPALPRHLRQFQPIVNKAMAKNPADRYESAAAMWKELYYARLWSFWRRPRLLIPADRKNTLLSLLWLGHIGWARKLYPA